MNPEKRVYQMTLQKYDFFKSQNPEIGRFDVIFEVGGKLLYAHRNMLTLISDTFDSMLSERWTTKDQPIKIADYSYDNFYQFLTFLYSGECELDDRNIFKMVDMAEFYGVDPFKIYCDEYLSSMTITNRNIFLLMDLVDKYSMVQLKDSVLAFIIDNFQIFTGSDGFFNVNKNIVKEIIAAVKDKIKPEDLFQAVYKWSENRALIEQTKNPNLNLHDQIKAKIADFLPYIRFCEMDLDFLHEFVVPKGFIFSSLNELSRILCDRKLGRKETGRFNVTFEVEGKLLYAHQNMLDLVSDTFDSMLSDRWTKKNEPIKIKDYSYADFYQFLTFLYSGECQLNDSNIFSMVDIAEFYGVNPFKIYCDEYLSSMTITNGNIFSLIDLVDKYSMFQLKSSAHRFITNNFQSFADCDGFMKLEKSVIKDIVIGVKDKVKPEYLFQAVYKWAENQAMNAQTADSTLNLNDAIKAEISDFLPHIYFRKMKLQFLHQFVVRKGFIFSSFDELSTILSKSVFQKRVIITNVRGQTLHGNVIPDKTVLTKMEALNLSTCNFGYETLCWWNKPCKIPLTPSPLKKSDGIEWYFIYYRSGVIGVVHRTELRENYYLLAELIPGPTGFETAKGCVIEIE